MSVEVMEGGGEECEGMAEMARVLLCIPCMQGGGQVKMK